MSLIADVHEPEDYRKMADDILELDVDYIISGSARSYAVERKTVSDLKRSVYDGRLWEQLNYLKQLRDMGFVPILVVEGLPNVYVQKFKAMTWKEWFGWLTGIASYGIAIITVSGKGQFQLLMETLKAKAGKKKVFTRPTLVKGKRSIEEERADMFASIDGVGVKTAEELIKRFKTPKNVCMKSRVELIKVFREILGSGEKDLGGNVGKHVCEVLGIEE